MSGMKVLVVGVSQTGKSTFALHLALSTGKQVVIWDANEVFTDVVKSPVYTPSDLRSVLNKTGDRMEPVIVYDATTIDDRGEEFSRFAVIMEEYDGHTLLVDEAGDVQRANSPNPGLDRLYRRAGRRGNDIIETTHKPQQIATLNRSLTTDVYLFAITRTADVEAVGREFSEEAAIEASHLPDYVYIHYFTRTGQFEKVDDPEEWYIPLDRPISEVKRKPVEHSTQRKPLFTKEV